MSRILY